MLTKTFIKPTYLLNYICDSIDCIDSSGRSDRSASSDSSDSSERRKKCDKKNCVNYFFVTQIFLTKNLKIFLIVTNIICDNVFVTMFLTENIL